MEDQIITHKTAKLVKEIGFIYYKCILDKWLRINSFSITQTKLQRYLREVRHIYVFSVKFDDSYNWRVDDDSSNLAYSQGNRYKTYEDALEIGLQKAMEILKKK
jgi:hypothetical protein